MSNLIVVEMADLKTCKSPDRLVTYGLGSCVGVTLFDPIHKIAGMAHVMLPDSKMYTGSINRAKFMDTALEDLVGRLLREGALKQKLTAKLAGGAHMFGMTGRSDTIKVGQRNAETALRILARHGIPVIARELGGTFGRTIIFNCEDGTLFIKTVGHGEFIV